MYFRLIIFIFLATCYVNTFAQNNPTLFTIDGNNVGLVEFKKAFAKKNQQKLSDNKELAKDFLNNYIEFNLKVAEAKKLNLNRDKKFKSQVERYKNSLVQPYINDNATISRLAKQAYQRMKTELKLRHILVKVSRYATPKDTLLAYQKALGIRKELINGRNFNELAIEVSDAPGTAVSKGETGYISAFALPYSIENYIYNTSSDNYSLPIRSGLGFHIVKIDDRRKNPGYFNIAHLLIANPQDTGKFAQQEVKKRIDAIYSKLKSGEEFKLLAQKYSEDISFYKNGEELAWLGTGFMPEEFEKVCIDLKNGSFSKPIQTRFGWHIIKKTAKKELPPYITVKEQVEKLIMLSNRGKIAQRKVIRQLKKDTRFKDYQALSPIWKAVDSTIFEGNLEIDEYADFNEKLFEFNNRTYYQKDFVKFLKNNQEVSFPIPIKNYVYKRYRAFIDGLLLSYKIEHLEKSNSDIAFLLKDYQETVLANNIMEAKVWSTMSKDVSGMKNYYNKNKEKYNNNYQADVTIFKFNEELKKIVKQLKKLKKDDASDEEIIARIKAKIDIRFDIVEKATIEEGKNQLVDKIIKKFKINELGKEEVLVFENEKRIICLNSTISKTNKNLEQVKNKVSDDYKTYFEKNWINQLKRKYRVKVNEGTFESIFNN